MPGSGPRVLIHVADPDLARALETGLLACGALPEICARLSDISHDRLSGQTVLFLDFALISARAKRYLVETRALGWEGLAVILAEDSSVTPQSLDGGDNVVVLLKPFGGAEILQTVRRARAAHAG